MKEEVFSSMSLAGLADHILRTHHVFTREEANRIAGMLDELCTHGSTPPHLTELRAVFGRLKLELENHLLKEERVLFPYIALMESSLNFGRAIPPAPFGSAQNPIAVMLKDHADAEEFLQTIRRLTDGYAVFEDANGPYRDLINALQAYEGDLNEHMRLENDLLFPKAIEMEAHGSPLDPHRSDTQSDLPILAPKHEH